MLVINKSTVYSQTTCDTLKCFTYTEAKRIISDLNQLPKKDSIISKLEKVILTDSVIIQKHEVSIINLRTSNKVKEDKILKIKRHRKPIFILGVLLGLATQLLF